MSWHRPIIPIHVDNDVERVELVSPDGIAVSRPMHRAKLTLRDEDVKRIAHGYACIHCQEPFERPYPALCDVCGFQPKKYQAEMFLSLYEGWDEPPIPMQYKLDALDEKEAKEKRDKAGKNNSTIVVGVTAGAKAK